MFLRIETPRKLEKNMARRPKAKSGTRDVKRFAIGFRVSREVRERLEAAARASGRSLSQEAETRLLFGLRDERSAVDLLAFRYGAQLGGILLLLAEVASYGESSDWLNDPVRFARHRAKIGLVLDALSPPDEPPPGTDLTPRQEDLRPGWTPVPIEDDVRQVLGWHFAAGRPPALMTETARDLWLLLGDSATKRAMLWARRRP
jgi:hypothetical protein